MSEISSLIVAAQKACSAGDFDGAEQLYQQILAQDPHRIEALHGLGGIAYQRGHFEEAILWLRRVTAVQESNPILHSNLGAAYRAAGRLVEAEASYRQALRLKPDFAESYNNLGNVLWTWGRLEQAEGQYQMAVLAKPDYAEAHFNLGLVLAEQEKWLDAREAFQQAARINPDLPHVREHLARAAQEPPQPVGPSSPRHQGPSPAGPASEPLGLQPAIDPDTDPAVAIACLARALFQQKNLDEAIGHCREALRINPELADAYVTLGRALADKDRLAEAVNAWLHALRIQPDHAEAAMWLGGVYRELGHVEKAVGYLQYALRLKADLAEAHCYLGQAFFDQVQLRKAEASYEEALRLAPHSVLALTHLGIVRQELGQEEQGHRLVEQALHLAPGNFKVHLNYGISLVNLGRFDEAKAHFLKAIALQPACAAAYFFLARDSNHAFTPEEIGRMEGLLTQESLPLPARINIHFALARVGDRAHAFADAFRHCDLGNLCKKQLLQWQGNAFHSEGHARFIDRLIALFDKPYFDRVRSFGLSSDLPVFIIGMPRSSTSLVEQILASHPAVFGAGELRLMKQFVTELPGVLSSQADFPECLDRVDQAASRRLAEAYVEQLRRFGPGWARVSDKMPLNFHNLGLIATLLPGAQIIHCRRDPRDVCWSCYFQNFREIAFACDLRMLGTYYRQYERLMAHWKHVLPIPILDVCYEELVQDLEKVSRQIVAFCKLPWEERCLAFHQTQRVVRTSSNIQVRQPVYRGSVGYWRNYESHLGPLLETLRSP